MIFKFQFVVLLNAVKESTSLRASAHKIVVWLPPATIRIIRFAALCNTSVAIPYGGATQFDEQK